MKKRNKRALIVTDRIELLFETGGTLEEFGLNPFNVLAGQMVQPPMNYQVYIGMSQTIRRRLDRWREWCQSFDVVVFDECHKQEFNPYFERYPFKKDAIILGFSATPVRTGKQRQLSDDYQTLIHGLQVPELIKRGRLVRDKYYGVDAPDMSGVGMNTFGDYREGEMFAKFNKTELYSGVVENWCNIAPDTITLVFCVNIQHTIETCKAFNEAGITAKFLTSDVVKPQLQANPTEAQKVRYEQKIKEYENYINARAKYSGDRVQILSDWKNGKFKVLINAGILTTGFNHKAIETVVVNRATTSIALWLQMLGRGSRTYPNKDHFNILDFGGNGNRLGYYNQQREWTLTHQKSISGGVMPVKECGDIANPKPDNNGRKGCGAYIFVSAQICPFCGYVFQHEKEVKFAELIKIDYNSTPLPQNNDFYGSLERTAEQRGYKTGWVLNQIISKEGEQGLKDFAKFKGYKNGWLWNTRKRYKNQIDRYERTRRTPA